MTNFLKIIIPIWCLFTTYWYVCEINDNNCSCTAKPKINDTLPLDSVGKAALLYLKKQDTMQFYFANKTIEFNGDSNVVAYLNYLSIYLAQMPDPKINMYGYADTKGNDKDNFILAQKRLQTIHNSFIKLGIKSKQISMNAQGEIGNCSINDELCLQKFRRVDVVIDLPSLNTPYTPTNQ